jgi:hypothetical protein
LANVVDANVACPNIVVEQKVEKLEETFEPVIIRAAREDRIRDASCTALDRLCETEQYEACGK